jgi:hypothetical protein
MTLTCGDVPSKAVSCTDGCRRLPFIVGRSQASTPATHQTEPDWGPSRSPRPSPEAPTHLARPSTPLRAPSLGDRLTSQRPEGSLFSAPVQPAACPPGAGAPAGAQGGRRVGGACGPSSGRLDPVEKVLADSAPRTPVGFRVTASEGYECPEIGCSTPLSGRQAGRAERITRT